MFHSMAALGLSHTTPSVTWVHTYIYILTHSHMLPLALLMHTQNTHAHNYSHTHPYADVYIQHSHSLTPSGDPEVQPAHLSPPWPVLSALPVPSHQHVGSSEPGPGLLGQPPLCPTEAHAQLDTRRMVPCMWEMPTGLWGWEGWKGGFLQHLNGIYGTRFGACMCLQALTGLAWSLLLTLFQDCKPPPSAPPLSGARGQCH